MCNIRSEEHFNISDGGIEETRRAICIYWSIPAASPSWALLNLEQSNISGAPETAPFNARSNLGSRCLLFFPIIMNGQRERERETEKASVSRGTVTFIEKKVQAGESGRS